jgi:TonB family protein
MRRRRHQRGGSILLGSFVGSVLVHALLVGPVASLIEQGFASRSARPPPVKVVRLSSEQWSRSMSDAARAAQARPLPGARLPEQARADRPPEPKPAPPKPPEPETRPQGQVVEVPPTQDDSPNPDAKYLSKSNAHVDRETVARMELRDPSEKRVSNKLERERAPEAEGPSIPTPNLTLKGDGAELDAPGKPGAAGGEKKRFVLELPDLERREEIDLKLSELPGVAQNRVKNQAGSEAVKGNGRDFKLELGDAAAGAAVGEGGGQKGARDGAERRELPSLEALAPTLGTIARISGSPSSDFVEGVPEGEGTFLNAKEFKYATFFYRVRDSVGGVWLNRVNREYRMRDPTGSIYGVRDRQTTLNIRLDLKGNIEEVRVQQSCGLDFLDALAVEAFRLAEPFPNPPAGIADADGMIRFNFGFVLTMGGRGPLDFLR